MGHPSLCNYLPTDVYIHKWDLSLLGAGKVYQEKGHCSNFALALARPQKTYIWTLSSYRHSPGNLSVLTHSHDPRAHTSFLSFWSGTQPTCPYSRYSSADGTQATCPRDLHPDGCVGLCCTPAGVLHALLLFCCVLCSPQCQVAEGHAQCWVRGVPPPSEVYFSVNLCVARALVTYVFYGWRTLGVSLVFDSMNKAATTIPVPVFKWTHAFIPPLGPHRGNCG